MFDNKISKLLLLTSGIIWIILGMSFCTPVQTSKFSDRSIETNTTATLTEKSRPLSPHFMCSNVNAVRVKSWRDKDFANAVQKLNPRMLRIPGGDTANYWDWQKGGLIENTSSLPDGLPHFLRYGDSKYTAGKLEDFQAALEATNTIRLFELNMLTSNLESQLEMLQAARDLGIPVKYIELGNEFYFATKNYRQVFPNPEDYAKTASQWISAIEKEFPEAKISVIGVANKGNNLGYRRQIWNDTIFRLALPKADAIAIHLYPDHGLDPRVVSETDYPFFTAKDVPVILGEPFRNWQKIQNYDNFKSIPKQKKIWLTEYNLKEKIFDSNRGKKPRVMGSWAHGMYTMAMSLLFLEDERIELICNHMLIGNSLFASILANEKSFVNPSDETVLATPLSLSATGSALRLLGDATEGMNAATQINFAHHPTLKGKDGFKYPALYGWMFSNEQDHRAVIMNLSDQSIKLDLSSIFSQTVNYEQISGSPRTLVTGSGILRKESGAVSGQISLPPYSVTKLSIR